MRTKLWSAILVAAFGTVCLSVSETAAQAQHGKEYWRGIAAKKYEVPEGEKAFALAKELSANLKSSDSELRDDLAYSILTEWILEKNAFTADELLALEAEWRGNLRAGIGESGTDSVFGRSFSALMLSALAERELKSQFLGEARYRTLLDAALQYLNEEKDVRGFDSKKGWIHATAHTADVLAVLVRHPSFAQADQARVLDAVGKRLATAGTIFSYGEQDRLANALAAMAERTVFDEAGFALWVNRMDKADFAIWSDSPPKLEGLQRFENDSYLLSAFVARVSQGKITSGAEEAKKAALESLKRR
jgi:uncharacterized protein DUF2785